MKYYHFYVGKYCRCCVHGESIGSETEYYCNGFNCRFFKVGFLWDNTDCKFYEPRVNLKNSEIKQRRSNI